MNHMIEINPDMDLEACNLIELSQRQMELLSQLTVSEWQVIKGGSFTESLDAWRDGPANKVLGLCFLSAGQPVGMVLFKRPPLSPSWASATAATIHGLKITQSFQGRGLGHRSFRLAIQRLKHYWPETTDLMLSVDSDNAAALAVYRACGMVECDTVFEGSECSERRFTLALKGFV